mgnify:CR=1 FL=1
MSKVVGIDLGTTFSAIAILDDLGNPEVLSDPENNNRITRSAVYIGREKAIVGDKAVDAAVTNKKNVIFEVKSEMENDVVWSSKEGVWIEKKEKKDTKSYVPSQVSSIILSKLKDYTSGVKKAIVTVPAMFAEAARAATLDAAKLAKLDVELINEPTAAVLHYANLPGSSLNGRVLIFDLGGGTFDITLAKVKGKKVDVITSVGDKTLGGRRFDEEIVNILDKKYKKAKGKGLDNPQKDEKIFATAEKIKKILSNKEKATEIIERRISFLLLFGFSIVFPIVDFIFSVSCLICPISSLLRDILFKQPNLIQKLAKELLPNRKQEILRSLHQHKVAAGLAGRMMHILLVMLFGSQVLAMLLKPKPPITLWSSTVMIGIEASSSDSIKSPSTGLANRAS